MCDKDTCNDASCCGECEPWNCLEQQVNDILATKEDQLQGYVGEAKDAAAESKASAEASAQSAAESKEFRDEAETAASTAVAAEGVVLGVANTLQDTADKLEQIADELGTAIAGVAVSSWFYTTVSENQTVIPVPANKNAVDVQSIYIEGARQSPFRGFEFDKTAMIITLAEPLPLGLEIEIILGTYNSDNPNDFAHTLASNNGASLVGTSSGNTVQEGLNSIDDDLIKLKLNWAIENGYYDAGFTFAIGGTLDVNDRNKVVYDPVSKTWYSYAGTLPVTVPSGFNPVGNADWKPQTDPDLRHDIKTNGLGGAVITSATTQEISLLNFTSGKVQLTDRDNCLFEVLPPGTATPDGYAYLGMPNGYVLALLDSNGSYNVRGAGAVGDGYNDDGLPIASLVKRAMQTKKGDFVFPAVGAGESYVLRTPVDIIFSSGTIDPPSITFRGVGSVNGLSMQTRIAHIRETYGIKQRNIGASYRDFQAIVYCGAPANIIRTGVNTITLDRNPFGGNGGTPVTWNSTVTAGDGTQYSSGYVQFATNAGSFYASSFTDNGDGTYTFGNVRHSSNASTDLTLSTRLVRFSCRAHFEPSDGNKYPSPTGYSATAGFLWADTLENIHIDHVWFLQQLRCIVHDLGSGGGGDSGIGNIGTVSNVIVDGAFSFMTNTDLSASSQQSLNGGHFSNVQFYSVRAPFVGRRIQNINMASLQLFSSDGLFFARDISHIAIPGAILGWDGVTGFCKNIVVCENIEDANFGSCVFGRHQYSTPVMTANSINGLSLSGSTLGTVSEGGVGGWLYVTGSSYNIAALNVSVSVAHLTGSGRSEITLFAEDITTTSVNMMRNKFSTRVYTNIARDLRDYDSPSSSYGYLYSGGSQNGGYSFSFSVDAATWTPSLKRKAIKLSGALSATVVKTLPSAISEPDNASDFIIDTSTVALGSYQLQISGYTLTAGVHVFKWVGSWILVSSR